MAEYYFKLPQITQLTISQQAALNETKQIALSGSPGTGKSVVSLWRHINNLRNKKKSLLLTYTTTLKMYFIGACKNEASKSDIEEEAKIAFENAKDYVKTSLRGKPRVGSTWNEIIIDEAQDLPIDYYGDIKYVAKVSYGADDSQTLYPESSSKQNELKSLFNLNEDYVLDKNFRSTQRIMQLAKVLFPNAYIPKTTIDQLANNLGELPILLISGKNRWIDEERRFEISNDKQDNAIISVIQQLTTETHNIAVLVPWKKDAIYFEGIIRDKVQDYSIYYEDDYAFPNGCGEIKNIHVTTFKSAKGLEFDTVIIPNFHSISRIDANIVLESITSENRAELQIVLNHLNINKTIPNNKSIIYLKIRESEIDNLKEVVEAINGIKMRIDMTWKDLYVGVTRARSNLYLISEYDMPQLNLITDKSII